MNWKRFNLANNLLGWLSFFVATAVYLLTIEPTASLWDCAEFVACDYSLEVGHPPGAPFYMLVYNVISRLAPTAASAALYANATSALLSGLCILFLFWTITHIARRLIKPEFRLGTEGESLSLGQGIAILGSGLIGALVYTFSDTFWFSAVEAEVYAFSSLFTAVVFWLMFKWEERSDEDSSDRWIILLAYLMGLSIGVHLLNLLCLPAMALVYYYKKAKTPTYKGSIYALLASFVLIVVMMYGIVQGVPKMAGHFDYFFVNTLGLSFNSGLFFYLGLLFCTLSWSIYQAHQALKSPKAEPTTPLRISILSSIILFGIPFFGNGVIVGVLLSIAIGIALFYLKVNLRFLYISQMSLLAIAIGFSSYGVILVRAIADTPMNENAPANAFSLRYYLAREQYGSTPLFYGPSFAAQPKGIKGGKEVFGKAPKGKPTDADQYTKLQDQPEYEYNSEDMMLFPRTYSAAHAQAYNIWMGRNPDDMTKPTMGENLTYFFRYQVAYMYWRYFMWNFSGRQNDLAGDGSLTKGNAITGIPIIDNMILGPTENLPDEIADNKGHNVYYMLPLLLGLLGIFYQIGRVRKGEELKKTILPLGQQSFWITFFLFFMTGLAILFYLNQTPGQPRERDYAYAGSFYAFSIWIGLGVAGLWRLLTRAKLSDTMAATGATLLGLFVPIQMAGQNWDDHDRSGRTIARDMGINYLESCDPNAILFCYGDNDTFPLWYIQDVEHVRTDIRTVNLSYLGGDWYIDQMKRSTYQAKPLPMKYMTPEFYYFNEIAYINPNPAGPMPLGQALQMTTQTKDTDGSAIFPTQQATLEVDVAQLAKIWQKSHPEWIAHIQPTMYLSFEGKRYLDRGALTALDMIEANKWERPIYWAITSPRNIFNNIAAYNIQSGMTHQLVPIHISKDQEAMDLDKTYELVMKKFRYGGADNPKVYMDETARNMMQGMRSSVFVPLANGLLQRGDKAKAQEVLKKCLSSIRPEVVPYDTYSAYLAQILYRTELKKEADRIIQTLITSALRSLDWYMEFDEDRLMNLIKDREPQLALQKAMVAYQVATEAGSKVLDPYQDRLIHYVNLLSPGAKEQLQNQNTATESTPTDSLRK